MCNCRYTTLEFVVLVGNDPTLSTMSRWRFPIKLQDYNLSRRRDSNPRCLCSNLQGWCSRHCATSAFLRSRLDSNQCYRFCRPVPFVFLHHSATGPFVGLAGNDPTTSKVSASRSDHLSYSPILYPRPVTIRLYLVCKTSAFPIKLRGLFLVPEVGLEPTRHIDTNF